MFIWSWDWYIWKLQFQKNQPFSKVLFAGHSEHSCDIVYLFFPEEDISPNDIGPHKSFNIPGTVSQPSGGHPTNRQTDGGEVLGKLQELYNERWAQRMSHRLRLIWFLQSERYCLVRNVTWAWRIFTQFSSSSVMEVISYWWTSERSFQVFINCWWVSWLNDVILICRIWIV